MCRYALSGPYKAHYACFACRKGFKQPPIADYLALRGRGFAYRQLEDRSANETALRLREEELGHRLVDLQDEYRRAIHKCPECGEPMLDMGMDFKPPRQNDAKAWKVLQGMYRVGHAFHTCGCDGPGWIPKSTSDYRKYLVSQQKHYEEQLAHVQRSHVLAEEEKQAAAEYWSSRIAAIRDEQLKVG